MAFSTPEAGHLGSSHPDATQNYYGFGTKQPLLKKAGAASSSCLY
jgi:hypothetical protein